MIVDQFNKQKINYLNEIKNIKNEILSEIKEELKKDDQINIENLDDN